ncbi:DNA polymerase III subunit beta [Candidatus Parcubacteria bacterium]|nr:DNA polymerase III subunit beta [Candidatus Parcubacteria bacterium]
MKLICLQNNLKHGLFVVGHIAGKNINLPILNNILIKTKEGNIQLITTNLEMGIINTVRGKIETEGNFTVDSKIFSDYVGLLPNKKVNIEKKENDLIINCENYKTKIKGQSAEDFPLIPEVDKKSFYSANVSELKQALSQAVFAVSTSEARVELSGVLFCFKDSSLTMAATDSYRLAEKKINIKGDNKEEKKVIVPAKTLIELLRILSSAPEMDGPDKDLEEIKFYISENQILFSCGPTELVSRLIEGQYPDYTQIIPSSVKTKAIINRAELTRAVKAASLFSKAGINDISLDFPAGKNSVIISAISGQAGENITELSANTSGNDNSMVVNYRYLLDGLSNIGSEFISMELVDGNTPCILRPADSEEVENKEKDYLYIIMPIKQ